MKIKNIIKLFLDIPLAAKYAKTRENDIFLVSFPKSGNTWLRFLIGNYLYDNIDFNNINDLIPDIHVSNTKHLDGIKKQRFIKSHFTFNPNYPKVIYIKRNIKDVTISYFYWFKKKNPNLFPSFEGFFSSFINDGAGPYGTWVDHINDWSKKAKKENILIVDYDDLKKNTYQEMLRVLKFCNLPLDKEKLLVAIKRSNINFMAKLENKQRNSDFFKSFKDKGLNFVRTDSNDRIQKLNNEQIQILADINNTIL